MSMVRRLLSFYIGVCATLVIVVQGLSVPRWIMPLPFILTIVVLGGGAAIAVRPRVRQLARQSLQVPGFLRGLRPHPLALPFLICLPVVAAISFVLGWHTPPNNWDSMAYHLSRAAYWRQWHTLAHFPTYKWNQNANPGNAEVLLLVTLLLTHTDTLAFLVQFSAYVAAIFAVYGLGRQIALPRVYALVGAGMFATMPEVVLQSMSAQNDLTAAAFTTCAAYFLLDAIVQRRRGSLIIMGAALGLAIGTKPTAFFALPGLGIGAIALLWRRPVPRVSSKGIAAASATVLLVFLLGAPWYIADKTDYGSFTGPPVVSQIEKVPAISATTLRVNVSRYLIGLIDPAGPALLTSAASSTCGRTATLRSALSSALRVPAFAPGTQAGPYFSPAPACFFNEDYSWFGLAGVVAVIVALVITLAALLTRRAGPTWMLAAGVTSYLLLFSLLLRWSPFQQRLLITMLALAAPLLGLFVQRLSRSRFGRPLAQLAVLYAALTGLTAATNNSIKPLGAWAADRIALQVITRPDMGPVLRHVTLSVPITARVGTLLQDDNWDYPLFGQHLDRIIEPLIPSTSTSAYAIQPNKLDYVLTHQPQDMIDHLFRRWRLRGYHKVWVVGVTDSAVPWELYTRRTE